MSFKRLRRRLQAPLVYGIFRLVTCPARWFPGPMRRGCASAMAKLAMLLPKTRRMLLANLEIALPELSDRERLRVASGSMRHLILNYLDFIYFRYHQAAIGDWFHFLPDDAAIVEELKTGDKGAILVSPHLGNWELGFLATGLRGLQTSAVARKLPNRYLEAWIHAARTCTGGEIIHEKGAVKGMMGCLGRGESLFLLVDQNTRPRHGGIFVEFFGLQATMSRAPALMARRQGVPIYLCFGERLADGSYQACFRKILTDDIDEQPDEVIARRINAATEELIRAHPEQYLWLYERWRYLPEEEGTSAEGYPFYASAYREHRPSRAKNPESSVK